MVSYFRILDAFSFGEWTSWTDCSKTCIDDHKVLPYRRRTRTCNPYCDIEYGVEQQPCVDLPACSTSIKIHYLRCSNIHIMLCRYII